MQVHGRPRHRFIPACAGNTFPHPPTHYPTPVHPRLCGEHAILGNRHGLSTGSSPPVRGTHLKRQRLNDLHRFIPACAGNTWRTTTTASLLAVHPRLCGEHGEAIRPLAPRTGSSPPVRGTLSGRQIHALQCRFIPACAGNTCVCAMAQSTLTVHPRLCGEHTAERTTPQRSTGSSPPVRGTPRGICPHLLTPRFIPACAGNTSSRPSSAHPKSVHPRLCGEHESLTRFSGGLIGSSPPVRGTQRSTTTAACKYRFIPACAGNTCYNVKILHCMPVHPRLCGEHPPFSRTPGMRTGSSPPVRGTRGEDDGAIEGFRFIPACAGNTHPRCARYSRHTVHPRLCGEHLPTSLASASNCGSSPPVRGTHPDVRHEAVAWRFIPACAGNTPPLPWDDVAQTVHPRLCGEHSCV